MTNMNKISVIIPTYREADALELCLRSCIEGQSQQNEILVICDGFYEENKSVLECWKQFISVIDLESNQGYARASNMGVYNASNEWILIVNDDNVFPKDWDKKLEGWKYYDKSSVLVTPNQIEPYPSIFKQFIIHDLGRDPKTFDLENFWEIEQQYRKDKYNEDGWTLPLFIRKSDYLKVGGWDESYPGPFVADWEFFYKCHLSGMRMVRDYNINFYHFVSLATQTPEKAALRQEMERKCHEFFQYKWGYPAKNPLLS